MNALRVGAMLDEPFDQESFHVPVSSFPRFPPVRPIPTEFLDNLFQRHQGNIRACLRELYDLCAQSD